MICTCKYTKICNINELCKLFYAGIPNAWMLLWLDILIHLSFVSVTLYYVHLYSIFDYYAY